MAGEELQQGGGGAPEPQAAPAVAPAPPAAQPSLEQRMNAAVPADAGQGVQGAPQPGQPQPGGQPGTAAEWQGVRDYARAQGIELPWQDDVQALQNLLQSHRQLQERNWYADLGRQIAPYAQQLPGFLQAQRAQQQPASQPPAWQPPPFKREWLQMVETDPATGAMRAKPGYDPSLPERVQAYADWRDKFLQEPESVLGPLVEERARAIVRQEQQGYQEQVTAQQLVGREAQWIFQGGQPGGPLTAAGQMYARAASTFYQAGLRDVRQLHAASVAMVQNAFLRQRATQTREQPPAGAPAPTRAITAPQSIAGALGRGGSGAPSLPDRNQRAPGLSLREQLMRNLGALPESAGAV